MPGPGLIPYRGYNHRGVVEAKTAVLLDCLGIAYVYEQQTHVVIPPRTTYTCDFFLYGFRRFNGVWLEVKGTVPQNVTPLEEQKAQGLANLLNSQVFIMAGMEIPYSKDVGPKGPDPEDLVITSFTNYEKRAGYAFCVCPWCGEVGLEYEANGAAIHSWSKYYPGQPEKALNALTVRGYPADLDTVNTGNDARITAAYDKARSAGWRWDDFGNSHWGPE
jgi:hypothetical protein